MISIVTPTYNEEENIRPLVEEIDSRVDEEYELIFVDGNSTDNTVEIIKGLNGDYPVKVLVQEERQGIGAAYQRGFKAAEGDIIVQLDADLSHPPKYIPDLVAAIRNGKEVAVGSRYVNGGDRKDPLHRRLFPLVGSYLYKYLLDCPVKDFTSGFKAYNRETADIIVENEFPSGFHFQAASLMELVDMGANVEEVPIEFQPRNAGEPKYSPKDLFDNGMLFAKFFLEKYHRPIKFGTVGFTGVILNTALLYVLTEHIGLYYLYSSMIAVESAIVSNFVFNDLWTFSDKGRSGAKSVAHRFAKFNMVSGAGLLLNVMFLWLFTEIFGIFYIVSNIMAIAIVFIWNYVMSTIWAWR